MASRSSGSRSYRAPASTGMSTGAVVLLSLGVGIVVGGGGLLAWRKWKTSKDLAKAVPVAPPGALATATPAQPTVTLPTSNAPGTTSTPGGGFNALPDVYAAPYVTPPRAAALPATLTLAPMSQTERSVRYGA